MIAQIPGEFSASNLSLFYNSHNPRSQRPLIWHKSVLMKETFSSQLGSGFCFFFQTLSLSFGDFPGGSDDKESACNVGNRGSIRGLGRSPGEGQATHSSILAWRIPGAEEPGRLQSMGSQRVGHD